MSKALVKKTRGSAKNGIVPAVLSGCVPGLGQLVNGETQKAIGVFVVAGVAGFVATWPLIGSLAWGVLGLTWLYAVVDGYLTGSKNT